MLSAISVKDLPSEASLLTFKHFMFYYCILIINYEWHPWMIHRSYESFIITKTTFFFSIKINKYKIVSKKSGQQNL